MCSSHWFSHRFSHWFSHRCSAPVTTAVKNEYEVSSLVVLVWDWDSTVYPALIYNKMSHFKISSQSQLFLIALYFNRSDFSLNPAFLLEQSRYLLYTRPVKVPSIEDAENSFLPQLLISY